MKYIADVLKKDNPSFEDYINCFEQVKADGSVAVIKFDGEREANHYTVFISFPTESTRTTLRIDHDDLKQAMTIVLERYLSVQE